MTEEFKNTARVAVGDGPIGCRAKAPKIDRPSPSNPADGGEGAAKVGTRESAINTPPLPENPANGRDREADEYTRESALLWSPTVEIPAESGGRCSRARARESAHNLSSNATNPAREGGGDEASRRPRESASARTPVATNPAPEAGSEGPSIARAKAPEVARPSDETEDRRFDDPLVAGLVETYRIRVRTMKSRNGLILQGKAMARALRDGDKKEGTRAYDAVMGHLIAGKPLPDHADDLVLPLSCYAETTQTMAAQVDAYDKLLAKMAKSLPIAGWVAENVGGVGMLTLAKIVGEAGDLSQYDKGEAGVWKRLGLAVIDGERQRKCADKDKALRHGYSPERRSVVWNMMAGVIKAQIRAVKDENGEKIESVAIGHYGQLYLDRKAKEAQREGATPIVAHNRAARWTSKRIIRDMVRAWRREAGLSQNDPQVKNARPAPELMAAE